MISAENMLLDNMLSAENMFSCYPLIKKISDFIISTDNMLSYNMISVDNMLSADNILS
jgi:hypothetical protein